MWALVSCVQSRWKPLQYAIKKQFAPIVIQAVLDNSDVKVLLASKNLVGMPPCCLLRCPCPAPLGPTADFYLVVACLPNVAQPTHP